MMALLKSVSYPNVIVDWLAWVVERALFNNKGEALMPFDVSQLQQEQKVTKKDLDVFAWNLIDLELVDDLHSWFDVHSDETEDWIPDGYIRYSFTVAMLKRDVCGPAKGQKIARETALQFQQQLDEFGYVYRNVYGHRTGGNGNYYKVVVELPQVEATKPNYKRLRVDRSKREW